MADTSSINRVKGTNDILPRDYYRKKTLQEQILNHYALYGYHTIETPILEHSELYLRKSGEDIVSRMYDFEYQNRRLCLRPELTAATIRAYVDNLQDSSLPVRLSYAGPVFRYEKPQFARYRQFTQVGLELIGTKSGQASDTLHNAEVLADAETIGIASSMVQKLGLNNYSLVLGNVEILVNFLRQIGLQGQLQNFLLFNMEKLRKDGIDSLIEAIHDIHPDFEYIENEALDDEGSSDSNNLTDILRQMSDDNARSAVLDFLATLNINIDSNRDNFDIVDGLLAKIKNQDQNPRISQAITFMRQLAELHGNPQSVLKEAHTLLNSYGVDTYPLERLEKLMQQLEIVGVDLDKISIDLGLNRGLQYYTSIVFEIYHDGLSEERKLGGGGRYDDLIGLLGGRQKLDTTGFSFGLERLQMALDAEANDVQSVPNAIDVLIIPVDNTDLAYTYTVASELRGHQIRVENAIRDRNVRNHLQYADKKDIPYVIIVGSDEREKDVVVLRDMEQGEEKTVSIQNAIAMIQEADNTL